MVTDQEMLHLEDELRQLLDITPEECPIFQEEVNEEEWEEEEPDFYGILKECAWNILHENPGTEFGDWQNMLVEQYPSEVVDALGTNPLDVFPALSDMWDCNDYRDPDTAMCQTFAEWAEYFATDRSVELYDNLAEARRKISRFKTFQKPV